MKRVGNGFKACCRSTTKRPLLQRPPDRGIYHCFGCGASGDVIKFVQEIEKVDFMMALEILARQAGVQVPKFSQAGRTRTSATSSWPTCAASATGPASSSSSNSATTRAADGAPIPQQARRQRRGIRKYGSVTPPTASTPS